MNEATTLPTLRLAEKTSVSARDDATPPARNVKLRASPFPLAWIVIWNIDWPAYKPNGGITGVLSTPRTAVPTYAVSIPDDC